MENIPKHNLCLLVRYGNAKIWYPSIRYTSIKLKRDIIKSLRRYYNDYVCLTTDSVLLEPTQCNYILLEFSLRDREWYVDGVRTAMPLRQKDLKKGFSILRTRQRIEFDALTPPAAADSKNVPCTDARPDYLHTSIPQQDWYTAEVASTPTMHHQNAQTRDSKGMRPPGLPSPTKKECLTSGDTSSEALSTRRRQT